ncbi:uncharacterized protein [Triticum aestivum]|uniref:uncharacterized protein n=1 Tax=Triticum aestivum TaxID=4565 RepID=UPI00098A45E7|nr:uncharacterized protein LOC123167345 [Triticum aestivum]XP_044441126.1 uncharacterized protein LOC123167345 [Triticum aestivum]XP_045087782.1 uncharacterized protein LOC109745238 [Aegilops tauschii subsp. strangulata]XP_045087783.1 uncharacterized protein LOC109745238 [Aegilops tauschii subsp. strangulata]
MRHGTASHLRRCPTALPPISGDAPSLNPASHLLRRAVLNPASSLASPPLAPERGRPSHGAKLTAVTSTTPSSHSIAAGAPNLASSMTPPLHSYSAGTCQFVWSITVRQFVGGIRRIRRAAAALTLQWLPAQGGYRDATVVEESAAFHGLRPPSRIFSYKQPEENDAQASCSPSPGEGELSSTTTWMWMLMLLHWASSKGTTGLRLSSLPSAARAKRLPAPC